MPSASSTGDTACTAAQVTNGIYTSIDTDGVVNGNAYIEQSGDWEAIAYSTPSPTPAPSVTPTAAPTAVPTATPPVATPTPAMITLYFGEYAVPSYSGNAIGGGAYTAAATNGCFVMLLEQPVGGTAGQARNHRFGVAPTPTPNAFGDGEPNEPGTEQEAFLDEGSMTSLSITGLTTTSGSGTFSFTNSAAATVSGTLTITGSETVTATPDLRSRLHGFATLR